MRKQLLRIHRNDFRLSNNNRLTYVYKTENKGILIEVTNVSLEIQINNKWETIIRYDNAHGKLHRHTRITINSNADIVDYIGVKQKGSQKRLLGWAIDDIKKKYIIYKSKFLERCRALGFRVDMEIY